MSISDIVKSGAMYGENAPSYKVKIEGLGGRSDDLSWFDDSPVKRIYTPTAYNIISNPIVLSNGKEVAAVVNQSAENTPADVYLAEFASPGVYLAADNPVMSNPVATGAVHVGGAGSPPCLTKLSDGSLIMAVPQVAGDGRKSSINIYKSANGLGTDFIFKFECTRGVEETYFSTSTCKAITERMDGSLWLSCSLDTPYTFAHIPRIVIFKSTDGGHTWSVAYWTEGANIYSFSKVIFLSNMHGLFYAYYGNTNRIFITTDGGASWSNSGTSVLLPNSSVESTGGDFCLNEDGSLVYCTNGLIVGGGCCGLHMQQPSLAKVTANAWDSWFYAGSSLATNYQLFLHQSTSGLLVPAAYGDGAWKIWSPSTLPDLSEYIPVRSISVSQSLGQAGSVTVEIDNKGGAYSYDGFLNSQKIGPNKQISIDLGYGSEQERVFYGLIDKTTASSFPQSLTLDARDYSKLALDGTIIRPTDGFRTFSFVDQKPEQIFVTLAGWAGYSSISVDTTDITIPLKICNWETYADVFGWLCDITGYDWWVDNQGAIYFRQRASNEPRATDEALSLALVGSDYTATVANTPVFNGSVVVTDSAGTTTYTEDEDYSIDLSTGVITALAGGLMASGGDILVSYTYPRHVFKEGEDILSISYTIDDADLYYKVVAYGQDASGHGIKGEWTISSALFGVQTNKLLKIDIDGVSTTAQLESIATKVGLACRLRARSVSVTAIGVPTVQVGDCVQIIESSSGISEIYRVTDLSYQFDGQFTMSFTAYYVGYAPVGGEPVE